MRCFYMRLVVTNCIVAMVFLVGCNVIFCLPFWYLIREFLRFDISRFIGVFNMLCLCLFNETGVLVSKIRCLWTCWEADPIFQIVENLRGPRFWEVANGSLLSLLPTGPSSYSNNGSSFKSEVVFCGAKGWCQRCEIIVRKMNISLPERILHGLFLKKEFGQHVRDRCRSWGFQYEISVLTC